MRRKAGEAGALAGEDSRLTLFASRGIDPSVRDAIDTLWRRARGQLRAGESLPLVAAPPGGVGRKRAPADGLTVLPLFEGEELLALLYVEGIAPGLGRTPELELERLARFTRTLASSVAREAEAPSPATEGVETYLERTPVHDIHRQKLLLLLERNLWNISRVARLMGVTRRTIYMRLRRYGIPRQRVYRTRLPRVAS